MKSIILNKLPLPLLCFILILITIVIYYQVIDFDFLLRWDDQWMVFNKYTTRGLNFENIWAIFNEPLGGQYSPVNQLTYTTIYYFFGPNPAIFHLGSLFWHIINVCLVFYLVYQIQKTKGVEKGYAITVSFITTLLFTIHPLYVEPVAWISASKVLLYSLFTLIALLCYLKYINTNQIRYYFLTFFSFIISFCCKEQALIFPFCLFLFDWFIKRDFKNRNIWLEKIPFFIFAIYFGMLFISYQYLGEYNAEEILNQRAGYSLDQRIILGCYAFTEYIVKLIIPVNLLHIYPFPMLPGADLPKRFLIYPVIIVVFILMLICYRKQRMLIFGVFFLLINLILTLHIFPMSRFAIIADRYVYLSGIGFFLIVAWYFVLGVKKVSKKYKKILSYTIVVFYLTYLFSYSYSRVGDWKNNETLNNQIQELIKKSKH